MGGNAHVVLQFNSAWTRNPRGTPRNPHGTPTKTRTEPPRNPRGTPAEPHGTPAEPQRNQRGTPGGTPRNPGGTPAEPPAPPDRQIACSFKTLLKHNWATCAFSMRPRGTP